MSKAGETRPYRVRFAWATDRAGNRPGPKGAETFPDYETAERFVRSMQATADATLVEFSIRREYPSAVAVGDVLLDAEDGVPLVVLPFDMAIRIVDGKPGALVALLPSDVAGGLARYTGPDAAELSDVGRAEWARQVRRKRPVDRDAPRTRSDNWPTKSIAPSGRRYYS